MKKSARAKELDDVNISPIKDNLMHEVTPMKPKRKTSRRDQSADVHAACSTPNRSSNHNCSFSSPTTSFPYSQENCPDVIWDYTSPKLPKGAKRREIKMTVDEFLRSLSQHQVPECKSQNSHYIKLLEKWMTKQNTPVCIKPQNNVRRNKKRSRRVIEEIKEFMESIKVKNKEHAEVTTKETKVENLNEGENNKLLNSSLNKISFLQGDSNENDSSDELWGEADNSFIIKATQQLDVLCPLSNNNLNKNIEIISTIPETIADTSNEPKCAGSYMNKSTEKGTFNNGMLDSDYHAQFLLTQIYTCELESDDDNDWEKGFIEEDDVLSLVPDEVLCGTDSNSNDNFHTEEITSAENLSTESTDRNNCEKKQNSENTGRKILVDFPKSETSTKNLRTGHSMKNSCENSENRSAEISFGYHETATACQATDANETENFNNFDDESFGDESILCKPEVLSWIDEVESQLTQSQRCTPEEIENKKDEASQRCTPEQIEKKKR